MPYLYVNNQYIDATKPFITADDRSFRFGDGIFETILVVNGKMVDAPLHFERLASGLAFFRIALDVTGLPGICERLVAINTLKSGYVRMVISRGANKAATGYLPAEDAPYVVVQTAEAPFPAYRSLSLCVSPHTASIHLPCKTNSAMLYTLSMLEARDTGCDNALILDAHGHVCETASGNIFWVKNGMLHTPETSLPFVPGTVRRRLLALSPLPVKEGRYTLADMLAADEIFMTNVGYLVAPITAIKGQEFAAKGDAVSRQMRALMEEYIRTVCVIPA